VTKKDWSFCCSFAANLAIPPAYLAAALWHSSFWAGMLAACWVGWVSQHLAARLERSRAEEAEAEVAQLQAEAKARR
jgi:hypothetical protein